MSSSIGRQESTDLLDASSFGSRHLEGHSRLAFGISRDTSAALVTMDTYLVAFVLRCCLPVSRLHRRSLCSGSLHFGFVVRVRRLSVR